MAKNAVNYTGLIPEIGDRFESATTNMKSIKLETKVQNLSFKSQTYALTLSLTTPKLLIKTQ